MRPIFVEGRRKFIYGLISFSALCGGAWRLGATFVEFRDGLMVWLAAMLAAHVTAEKVPKKGSP